MSRSLKIALYPCCASDILEPLQLLEGYVDEVLFCDVSAAGEPLVAAHTARKPRPTYVQRDLREYIDQVGQIDVLFYRRDGAGEGGSGLYILGDEWLRKLLPKFKQPGGLIITDGSNSRGNAYRKMRQQSGLRRFDCHVKLAAKQPLQQTQGLLIFDVQSTA